MKITYYELQIRFFLYQKNYFECSKCYRAIFGTPKVQGNNELAKLALLNAVIYLLLAPFDAEYNDFLYRLKSEKLIAELPSAKLALEIFTTFELASVNVSFEAEWNTLPAFSGEEGLKRFKLFQKRIVQHNIRVLSKYYTRLYFPRLATLLNLSEKDAEESISEMVSTKQLYAKIDRGAKICVFAKPPQPSDVLNNWSQDVSKLLTLVEECTHLINKEEMVHAQYV